MWFDVAIFVGIMYVVDRLKPNDFKGANYKKPSIEALCLEDKLKAIGVDLNNSKTVKNIISLISIEDLLLNKRINDIVCIRMRNRQKTQEFKYYSENVLSLIHSGALISRELFNSIGQLPSSPLRGLSSLQISILVGAWLHQKLNERVFTAHNLIAWGSNLRECREGIYLFQRLGYVQKLDYKEVFKYSKKLQGNRNRGYYILTREGERALKDYFKLFAKRLEKILGQSWDVPLLKIIKEED